jgi:hypothetical protein
MDRLTYCMAGRQIEIYTSGRGDGLKDRQIGRQTEDRRKERQTDAGQLCPDEAIRQFLSFMET